MNEQPSLIEIAKQYGWDVYGYKVDMGRDVRYVLKSPAKEPYQNGQPVQPEPKDLDEMISTPMNKYRLTLRATELEAWQDLPQTIEAVVSGWHK